ncbi:MAG: DUF4199 domain-containing protein [Bacteroidetes bacterium]|nr:DUF4199 domain-containing protein [Bacteroidota bacterium]
MILMGIAIGLFIGMLDSMVNFINFESYKIINLLVFLVFFIGVYWSVSFHRSKIGRGIISYGSALKNTLFIGFISSLIIAGVRFTYLKYIVNTDINTILDQTKKTMTDHYSLYNEELINNRLSFIEFSYDPAVSAFLYFTYYMLFVIAFAIFASIFARRIDRNISI